MFKSLRKYIIHKQQSALNYRLSKYRARLKSNDFTIICNNCVAGVIYNDLKIRFNSPTINLFFYTPDYLAFLKNLKKNIDATLIVNNHSRYFQEPVKYPVGHINEIEIHFLHFESNEKALEKWDERKKRINWGNLFIIGSEKDFCTKELITDFDQLPFDKKLFLTAHNYPNLKSTVWIDKYKKHKELGNLINDNKIWYNYFDIITWLNEGKIRKSRINKYLGNFIYYKIND